jgi:hypothetical protein
MSSQGTILTYRIEVYGETEEENTMGMFFYYSPRKLVSAFVRSETY